MLISVGHDMILAVPFSKFHGGLPLAGMFSGRIHACSTFINEPLIYFFFLFWWKLLPIRWRWWVTTLYKLRHMGALFSTELNQNHIINLFELNNRYIKYNFHTYSLKKLIVNISNEFFSVRLRIKQRLSLV